MPEAQNFSRYILGREATDAILARYELAVATRASALSYRDERILRFANERPWSIGPLDAALAIFEPSSALRRRLIVMASVIEASPDDADRFLSLDRSPFYVVNAACIGLRAFARLLCGSILLRVI